MMLDSFNEYFFRDIKKFFGEIAHKHIGYFNKVYHFTEKPFIKYNLKIIFPLAFLKHFYPGKYQLSPFLAVQHYI